MLLKYRKLNLCVNKNIPGRTKKKYDNDNREEKNNKAKQYRSDHKEEINKKIICGCGGQYTHKNKARHERTSKHHKYLYQIDTEQ